MGTLSSLTKEQKIILDEIGNNKFFDDFYFTGGTALNSIYLHHRLSEDLDFFSQNTFDNQIILTIVTDWSKKYNFTFQSNFAEVVYIFNLIFKGNKILKVDFGRYPYRQLEKGQILDGVLVDSLTDIAVNKLLTITQRSNVKDFVDLYFLLDKFTIWDLMDGVKIKFGIKMEPFIMVADFLKVEDFENMPKMIKPLKLEDLKLFFRDKAKQLGKMVTKK